MNWEAACKFGGMTMNDDTIYGLFRQTAAQRGGEPAIIENDRILTFSGLSDMVDLIAGSFPDGVRRIGILMSHRAEMIAAMLAALKCGASYVPCEPDFPIGRIRYMMEESQVDFVLTEEEYADRAKGFPIRWIDREIQGQEAAAKEKEKKGKENRKWKTAPRPNSPAYVLYTSGTTGRPKGVCVLNRNVCHYVRAFAKEFHPGPGDVMLQYSVCSFDIFVEEVFASLLNGAALAIPSPEDKRDIPALMGFVDRLHVTMLSGFPYLLAKMNRLARIPSSLRLLISGGDVLRGAYVDHLLGQAEVYNTYGPSETTVCASYYRCNGGTILPDGTYPLGRPVQGCQIRVLDKDGKDVPKGEVGEICIYGGGVSAGYVGSHEEESRAFEPLADGGAMYRSGDLGYLLPDGNLAFTHRKDTQIMIFGKRVEIMEVESTLCQCEGVEQAIVRAFPDESGLPYMIAYVVLESADIRVSDIREELGQTLAPFMIPEFIVRMPQIPLNSNGKPDTAMLPVVMKGGSL